MIDQAARNRPAVRRNARFRSTLQVLPLPPVAATWRSRPRVAHSMISRPGSATPAITTPASRHDPQSEWAISGNPMPAMMPPIIDQAIRAPLSRVRSS